MSRLYRLTTYIFQSYYVIIVLVVLGIRFVYNAMETVFTNDSDCAQAQMSTHTMTQQTDPYVNDDSIQTLWHLYIYIYVEIHTYSKIETHTQWSVSSSHFKVMSSSVGLSVYKIVKTAQNPKFTIEI